MSDPQELELEAAVRDLIVDLCQVLYGHGYSEISVGALMRVIGVTDERAAAHDDHVIDLLEQFGPHATKTTTPSRPPGTVLH